MNILVCVKQVPGSNHVQVDQKTGLLIRPQIGNKLNPFDLFSVELALKIKEQQGGTVSAMTMGPPQAVQSVLETLYIGCDAGYVLSDRKFGGADVLATSYTLSQGIKKAGDFDLILCGKQTTDGDTAQVGAELAEHLDIPHLSNVFSIERITDEEITIKAYQENLIVKKVIQLPCLLCVDSGINTPRLPSYKRKKSFSGEKGIQFFSFSDFDDKDENHYGLKGSPTQVQKIFPPDKNNDRKQFEGVPAQLTGMLFSVLEQKKFI